MGGSQSSPRKISIPNEEITGVIKVSDNVVKRLKTGDCEGLDDGGASSTTGLDDVRKSQHSTYQQQGENVPSSSQQMYYAPSLTSLQILQEKEAEIRKNDLYWEQRLSNLQENHRTVNKVLEEEYDKAVQEVADRFQHINKNATPPCQDMKGCVVECYKRYPKNTLACSPVVQAYSDCVDASRRKVIARG